HSRIVLRYIKDPGVREKTLSKLEQRIEKLGKYLLGVYCLEDIPNCADDMLLSYGERLSSLLLESILQYMKIESEELLPENIGLVTDGEYGNATIDLVQSKKNIKNIFSENITYVIPGFYGISTEYRITTLGRGGSDYSASAIAYCINASSVDIWKDVSGFLSADPGIVKHPVSIKQLSYNEAAELSYFGAKIFHPLTFEPLLGKKIPVRIFDINKQGKKQTPLTIISNKSVIKRTVVKSVACIDNIGVIKLSSPGIGIKSNILSQVIDQIAKLGVNIKTMISSMTSINILVSKPDLNKCCRGITALNILAIDTIECYDDSALIALVGEGMDKRHSIAVRAFKAVAEKKINIQLIASGASRVAIYFLVERKNRTKTIKAIHNEFF
ncbi:aspartate kinase, partial [bacterium]|nr:aspartate kinase [bacterium]